MVLLHQHEQTGEWHSEHLGELLRIDRGLLGLEHSRLILFDLPQPLYVLVVLDALLEHLAFFYFISHVSLREVLPLVADLFVDQSICLLENLSDLG